MTSGPEHPLIRRLVDTGKLEYLLRGAGIFLRDYSSGIGFSNTFWRECGYGELEMGWEEWVEFVHPQDKFRIVDAVRKLQEGKGDFFTEEYRIRDRRGRYRWVRSRALVLERAPDGMPSLYLGMDLEITDLMNRLESERAVREELEQRYHEAEVLRKATMEATASADPEEAIGRILARSRGIVSADVVLIWAVTEDGLECLGAIGSDRFPPVPRDRLPKIIAWVLEERRPRRNLTRPVRRGGNIFRDSLYMPVVSRGRVLGVLEFLGRGARALGHRAEGPAALFADSVAVVLESALALRELDQEASLDWLTNLSTRRRFDFRARAYLEGAAENATFCALMIDLDRFKVVNDTFGHAAGDRALAAAAGVCRDALRSTDLICRYGGEEIAILLPGADASAGRVVAERIRSGVEALRFLEHPALRLTVSLGVSVAGGWCRDLSVLLAEADAALFQAKAGGRNQVVLAECPVHR